MEHFSSFFMFDWVTDFSFIPPLKDPPDLYNLDPLKDCPKLPMARERKLRMDESLFWFKEIWMVPIRFFLLWSNKVKNISLIIETFGY